MNTRFVFLFCAVFASISDAFSQAPLNDNCENASLIDIPDQGYGFGKFLSYKSNVSEATRQQAEHCIEELEESGNCTKTVWYKFYIASTRDLSVKLTQQDSAIPQIFAGFNIYSIPDCNYTLSDLSKQLVPLNKFGISGNTCLSEGWYLIQVGCKMKAKGELWVELNLGKPSSMPYDQLSDKYVFPDLGNGGYSRYLSFNCSSLEPGESQVIGDSNFNRSIWLQVSFEAGTLSNSVFCKYSDLRNARLKYRIFKDTATSDSIKSSKPFIELEPDGYFYREVCPANGNSGKKIVLQIITDNQNVYLDISAFQSKYNSDDWNTPATGNIYNLDYSYQQPRKHYYNCEALLAKHKCKQVIPEYFVRNYKIQTYGSNGKITDVADTFRFASYTILNVKENGRLNVETDYTSTADEYYHYALYLGDIRNSCNLILLHDTFINERNSGDGYNNCVNAGNTYTLLTSVSRLTDTEKHQRVQLNKPDYKKKYFHPKQAEKIKSFDPLKDTWFSSEKIDFKRNDTTINIDTVSVSGSFSYHEIYISESADLSIVASGCGMYLFGGQISNGTAYSLTNVSYAAPSGSFGFYKSGGFTGGSYTYGKCFYLPKGYYTIVSVMHTYNYNREKLCFNSDHWINFVPNLRCPANNNTEPGFAFPINGNQDVLSATDNLQGLTYVFQLNFCKDCDNGSILKPKLSCNTLSYVKKNSTYYYYTFFLSENASFYGPSVFELFEGNAMLNPQIVSDSSRIISPCSQGNMICNLRGNTTYTLVVPMNIEISTKTSISFVRHTKTPNDYAAAAYDFGHFPDSDKRNSNFVAITCHTGASKTDPSPYQSYNNNAKTVPYKDTLNKRSIQGGRNIWYTFTVSGYSSIKLKAEGRNGYISQSGVSVFRYKGVYRQDYKQALKQNFDSTMNGMQYVKNNSIGSGSDIVFYNESCMDNRYFVLINGSNAGSFEVALEVSVTKLSTMSDGDHCSNAVTGIYKTFGDYNLSTGNACHTYGGSAYESGTYNGYKSSWFRIKVEGLKRFDLSIKPTEMNGLESFNVYGGTCDAMTRISKSSNRYSYFTLTCMGSGEYFIQAICRSDIDANSGFSISITDPGNTVCKPYDFKYPIALFELKGGCHRQDSIFTSNLSTKGDDISYRWFINGLFVSNSEKPLFMRTDQSLKDSNTVTLIVFNSAEFTSDTFSMPYIRDTKIYNFEIKGPPLSYCYDTLRLGVKTDFTKKLNYRWSYLKTGGVFSYEPVYTQSRVYDYDYVLYAESDNCEFSDTFYVNLISTLKRFRDTAFCQGGKYIVKNNTNDNMYVGNELIYIGDSMVFPDTKKIIVSYSDSTCNYNDTVQIKVEYGPKLLSRDDALYYCNVSEVELGYAGEPLLNYDWSTGDTTKTIKVVKSGTYRLYGAFSKCRSLDQTYRLLIETLETDRIKDSTVCLYDEYTPFNPYGNRFSIVSQIPENSVKVSKPFLRILKVKRGNCIISDSGMLNLYPHEGRSIDTFYCEHRLLFSFGLDGGMAKAYNWYEHQAVSRVYNAGAYGKYPLARIDMNGCRDTLRYNLITNCEFNVYIPDAFTPNADGVNENFAPQISGLYGNYNMSIFNRWGEQVYKSTGREGWDGTYRGAIVMEGVYSYLITIYDKDGKSYVYRGTLVLMY